MTKLHGVILFSSVFLLLMPGCGGTGLDERFEESVLASIEIFSTPDSSRMDALRVRIAGVLGNNTGYSFRQILSRQTDTLFEFQVYGTYVEQTGKPIEIRDVRYDTTLSLTIQQPRTTWYYFKALASNGTFLDSSFVHP